MNAKTTTGKEATLLFTCLAADSEDVSFFPRSFTKFQPEIFSMPSKDAK